MRLEEAIIQTKARLVVLDPIQGFLGADVDMHRANEIRPVMKRVAVLAEKYQCAIILIGHMNKNSSSKCTNCRKSQRRARNKSSMPCKKFSCTGRKINCFSFGQR